jgi:uncharacterized membrane protein
MKRSALIASAVAAALATPALGMSNDANNDWDQGLNEKCYGVSAKDMAACGAQSCASQMNGQQAGADGKGRIQIDDKGRSWALVPQGTCMKLYGGTLFPRPSS